jgi:hypothetical protein
MQRLTRHTTTFFQVPRHFADDYFGAAAGLFGSNVEDSLSRTRKRSSKGVSEGGGSSGEFSEGSMANRLSLSVTCYQCAVSMPTNKHGGDDDDNDADVCGESTAAINDAETSVPTTTTSSSSSSFLTCKAAPPCSLFFRHGKWWAPGLLWQPESFLWRHLRCTSVPVGRATLPFVLSRGGGGPGSGPQCTDADPWKWLLLIFEVGVKLMPC